MPLQGSSGMAAFGSSDLQLLIRASPLEQCMVDPAKINPPAFCCLSTSKKKKRTNHTTPLEKHFSPSSLQQQGQSNPSPVELGALGQAVWVDVFGLNRATTKRQQVWRALGLLWGQHGNSDHRDSLAAGLRMALRAGQYPLPRAGSGCFRGCSPPCIPAAVPFPP